MKSRVQFDEIHVKEKNERGKDVTRIVKKQILCGMGSQKVLLEHVKEGGNLL